MNNEKSGRLIEQDIQDELVNESRSVNWFGWEETKAEIWTRRKAPVEM